MIYCDYNATAPLRPEAREVMLLAMEAQANPSSVHGAGRSARRIIERSRQTLSSVIGARSEDLYFTSGGTEANALALHGALAKLDNPVLLYCDFEHPAVRDIAVSGRYTARKIKITPEGRIDLSDLERVLGDMDGETPFLTLMLANNETGIIQPVEDAARLVRNHGGLVHTDAVQAVGKIPVNVGLLSVDYLTMSAHKIGGPQGIGALWMRAGAPLLPQQIGGGQEKSIRSGTENLVGIAGFSAAMEAIDMASEPRKIGSVRNRFEMGLAALPVTIFGRDQDRLPGTSCFALEGFKGETQVMAMDLAGFAVSSGSACSSGKVKKSVGLVAMGVDDNLANSALRVSFGYDSTEEDASALVENWLRAAKRAHPEKFKEYA